MFSREDSVVVVTVEGDVSAEPLALVALLASYVPSLKAIFGTHMTTTQQDTYLDEKSGRSHARARLELGPDLAQHNRACTQK